MHRHSADRRVAHAAPHVVHLMFAVGLAATSQVQAAPGARATKADASRTVADLRVLATQKPWACAEPGPRAPDAAWQGGEAECAWQNRLRKRTWRWSEPGTPDCVSRQARWWAWMHAELPAGAPRLPWHADWSRQSDRFALDGEQRVLMLERDRDGAWVASEWRWNPSPRAATRRWQEGRWKLLTDLAAQRRQAAASATTAPAATPAAPADVSAARLQSVFGAALGARPGEVVRGAMRMETDGACLTLADPLPGRSRLPLSYRPDDSRLEQRAAMHLLLSRQYPQATWLAPFHLVPMPADVAGGAKFMATWLEADQLKGQLWIPSKEGTPTVRIRMTTAVRMVRPSAAPSAALSSGPLVSGPSNVPVPPSLTRVQQIVERELRTIAVRWAQSYE